MATPNWVVRRDESAHEILAEDGSWGTMDDARWFDDQAEALQATVPEGTTGTPVQVHPETPPTSPTSPTS
ncbi:MAG: hypothetical protein ACR2HQ_12525 [Ilumatobacteraceae bacterium]